MQDHLMEAVEGTLRLKRLLSEDDEVPEEVLGKRRRKKQSGHSPDEAIGSREFIFKMRYEIYYNCIHFNIIYI